MKENKAKKAQMGTNGSSAAPMNSERLELQKKLLSAIMAVGASDMAEKVLDPDTKAVFRYLNDFLSHVIPLVEMSGGEVNKISEQGVMALYAGNVKSALVAAVSLCEKLLAVPNGSDISVALCYGYVMSGIVGHGRTYASITLSEYTGLAGYLQENAFRYGCHIAITESIVSEISDFKTAFHARYLGRVYLSRSGTYERLYDVFDGDPMEMRINKMKTRTIFERAVNRFDASDFRGARAHFIEVLKADRKDLAAKEYLYLCDRHIAEEENAALRQKGHLLTW